MRSNSLRSEIFRRFVGICIAAILYTISIAAAAEEPLAPFDEALQPFLKQYCYECHGSEKQEARVRYDQLTVFDPEQLPLWTMVHERLSAGEMPPEDHPQPTTAEIKQVLAWIESRSAAAAKELGSGTLRRLNRRELTAALQSLTGLRVNYADSLPGDGTLAGFDTGAVALQDAADSVAQVMRVTRRAVEGIRFLEDSPGEVFHCDLRPVTDTRKAFDPWKQLGVEAKPRGKPVGGIGLWIEPNWVGERGSMEISVPPPADRRGILRLKLTLAAVMPKQGTPHPMLWVEVGAQDIDFREITGTPEAPQVLEYLVQIDELAIESKGIKIALTNKVEIPYAIKGFENEDKSNGEIEGDPGLFRPMFDKKQVPYEEQPVPFIVLQEIEIERDYVAAWPPPQWESAEDANSDDSEATASRLLSLWIERAWRRPVASDEQARFLEFYRDLREQQMSFDDALRATFQTVLMSSGFRYLPSVHDDPLEQAQYAIASRLSFMLTGGPPDSELLDLAAQSRLRDPQVLRAQVDRLLDDPRSDAFVRPFVTQWLVLDQPITIVMDDIQKQDFRFGRYLKTSMREETIAYVAQLLAENRPARELIESDWTMMNQSLAIHYGYPDIQGGELRKVSLQRDDPRGGGILAHAGIQSMLCWMGENWVIYRGAWVLRHLLDDPPPPPPLEVPELIPSDGSNAGKTFKELLKQHQEHEKCAVCHKSMDPLGFAFQNFDLSGRWRELEYEKYSRSELDGKIEWKGSGKSRPVDAVGHLPRGEEFTSFSECKQLMANNYLPDVVTGLLKNLVIYGTGRQPSVADRQEIRQIVQEQAAKGYPMRDLVKAIVQSEAFLGP